MSRPPFFFSCTADSGANDAPRHAKCPEPCFYEDAGSMLMKRCINCDEKTHQGQDLCPKCFYMHVQHGDEWDGNSPED